MEVVENGSPTPPPGYTQYPRYIAPQVRFDVISEAFTLFSQKPGVWVLASLPVAVVTILYYIASFALAFAQPTDPDQLFATTGIQLALAFGYGFVFYFAIGGLMRIAIMQIRGLPFEAKDAFQFGKYILPILLASIGMGLLTMLGFMFCCVPGLIVAGMFMITYPFIVDQGLGGATAMQRSWETLRPHLWQATGVNFVLMLIVSAASSLFIGVILALPIWALGMALVYRDVVILPSQAPSQAFTPGASG